MKLSFIIFLVIIQTLFISASHEFLDSEKRTEIPPASLIKKLVRIDLDKSETLNENSFSNEVHSTTQESTKGKIDSQSNSTTEDSNKVPLFNDEDLLKKSTIRSPTDKITTTERHNHKYENSSIEKDHSVNWFMGGALAGIVLSFIVFYVYSFYKFRTASSYQNV